MTIAGDSHEDHINDAESVGLLKEGGIHLRNHDGRQPKRNSWMLTCSLVMNVFLLVAAIWGWACNASKGRHSYEKGFSNDMEAVKPHIELEQTVFTGGVHLDKEGNYFTDHRDESMLYAGPPSDLVDGKWYELLSGLNIDLEASEAPGLKGRTFQWPEDDTFFTGLEVYHSLHCLNRLRQALHPEYYTEIFNRTEDPNREDHIGHCINHLRQAIQCHADLTPMEWDLVGNKLLLNTSTLHTCRNWDKIHGWAQGRMSHPEVRASILNGQLVIVD